MSCKKENSTTLSQTKETKVSPISNEDEQPKTNKENIQVIELQKNCNETFESFFDTFSSDSIFQKNRVKYPLKELYADDLESSKMKVNLINISNYRYQDFTVDKNAMNNEYGKYTIEIDKKSESSVHYKHLGYDNGISITYKFNLIEGCWYLVEIEDMSA